MGFWEDDAAIDAFVSEHPIAAQLADGWHARLEPLRKPFHHREALRFRHYRVEGSLDGKNPLPASAITAAT